jgi:hypothetical protein
MTLRDDERRSLAAIERSLIESDPHLARLLVELVPLTRGTVAAMLGGCLAMHAGGIVIAVTGAEIDSPVTAVIGALLATGFPALAGWHLWWRRR